MTKQIPYAALLLLSLSATSFACTTFLIPQSPTKVMAKSFDWHQDQGLVLVNKRNVAKTALGFNRAETPAKWVSRFGSVSFNQAGRDFPLSGINEKGLAVEIMWLDSSVYPGPDSTLTVNELQWIQYMLDGAATTTEAIQLSSQVKVDRIFASVHYMACDASGECATFEYIDGKMVIHSGPDLPMPVLTNNTYQDSFASLARFSGFGGSLPIPQSADSLDRFAQASSRVKNYSASDGSPIDYAFGTLDRVSQGNYSKWNIVYETAASKAHYRTHANRSVKDLDTKAFDYSCKTPVQMVDINGASAAFTDYTVAANQKIVDMTLKDIAQFLPAGANTAIASYPEGTVCQEK